MSFRNRPSCFLFFCLELTYTFAIHLADCSESNRLFPFLLSGIKLHIRISFDWQSGINRAVSFSSARNPTTCASFFWQTIRNLTVCLLSFCPKSNYTFAFELIRYLESIRLFPYHLFGIHHHVCVSFGRISGIQQAFTLPFIRNAPSCLRNIP